ncbi:MAG: Bax inhibitor-1/YccA family protein [Actinobacteria bacterium]|nr:Bax inhibitor-1/YccA family protein [Actinomycetota bacterium]
MSRNPILTDKAFGLDGESGAGGLSPAEEWQRAQGMGAGQPTTSVPPTAAMPGAPPVGATSGSAGGADAALARRGMGRLPAATDGKVMTMGGVASASLVLFVFLFVAAAAGWRSVVVTPDPLGRVDQSGNPVYSAALQHPWLLFVGMFVGLGLAFLTAFKPQLARFTGILYALCQGYVIGAISAYYGAQFPGIVAQAILATLGVFVVMLALYGLRVLRATPKFVKGVIAATFGIMVVYGVMLIANLFGIGEGFWTSGSPLGIVISLVVVTIAAMNLILDFDFIERGQQMGLPRYMDWYAAFGLLVTLIWLYLEMLRLLARLRQ